MNNLARQLILPPQEDTSAPDNTAQAYAMDWADFTRWCRMQGVSALTPSADLVGRYIADLGAAREKAPALSVASIERRVFGLCWNYRQRGMVLDRTATPIADTLEEIRRADTRPPVRKDKIGADDIRAMVATLPFDLRGLRDRALLLTGYSGGLRRSQIVGLDRGKDDTPDGTGWIDISDDAVVITLRERRALREVRIGRRRVQQVCAVHALEQWLHFGRIGFGPVFVAVSRDGQKTLERRLNDKHVVRLIKQTVLAAGLRPDLPEAERQRLFAGQSLRGTRATDGSA
ncbi:MAG: integrase [Paracoccaceae bacterium]